MKKNNKNGQGLKVVNPNAAGIDIGSRGHYVSLTHTPGSRVVKSFGCPTSELGTLARGAKD